MIQPSTQALLAAQDYVRHFMTLDEKGFIDSLADDVVARHARITGGFASNEVEAVGKANVVKAYHDYFFAISSNFNLISVDYTSFGYNATADGVVDEDKVDTDQTKRRYHMVCKTQLQFNNELKITHIWERTTKDLIPSLAN